MKTSLFGGRSLRLVTRRRKQVEALSPPLKLFIAGEYLTVDSGAVTFTITVAQSTPAPAQSATLQTVMPVTVAQVVPAPIQAATAQTVMPVQIAQAAPAPTQSITAEAGGATFEILISQVVPAPSQSASATAPSSKPLGAGGPRGAWEYRPPIYAIRTNGRQSAPAPSQRTRAEYVPARVVEIPKHEPVQATYSIGGVQYTLAPSQSIRVKSHRDLRAQVREEHDILALLASL